MTGRVLLGLGLAVGVRLGVGLRRLLGAVVLVGLAGCASAFLPGPGVRVLVFGEQHDQVDQQRQVAAVVSQLASAGRLRAVVLEMADRGMDTSMVPRDADEGAVRAALKWNDAGWPWVQYGPVVMAAVRAGVPVVGGNLPRAETRAVMGDVSLDQWVSSEVRERLSSAIQDGHCGLMPAAMLPGMLRVQIARDRGMAEVVRARLGSDGTVLLLAGAQHASRDRGVPLHFGDSVSASEVHVVMFGAPGGLVADERRAAEVTAGPDRCEALRQKMAPASR